MTDLLKKQKIHTVIALAFIAILGATSVSWAENHPSNLIQNTEIKETMSLEKSTSFSGGYLAGRFAQHAQDWDTAQHYMSTSLDYDANNKQLIQRTFLLAVGAGVFDKAKTLALKISKKENENELSIIFLTCDALREKNFQQALDYLDQLPIEGFGQYTKPLLTAWSLMGLNKKEEALKILNEHTSENDPTYFMHAGMMEELSGNMDAAADHYKKVMSTGLDIHTAIMIANFYERYGQPEISHSIYKGLDKIYPFNPFVSALSDQKPGRKITPNITNPADGASLALFDLASLLYEKRAYDSAQIYGNLVQLLDPNSAFAKLMMGDIAALHQQYNKAITTYSSISETSPIFWLSHIRVAEVYEISNQVEKSIEMLISLSKNNATRIQALVSLGDVYRRHDKFKDAIHAYDQALLNVSTITPKHWPVIYARGIAKERVEKWEVAEKDLLKALSFQPNNPMILNFIAYSWAEKGVKLKEALKFAKQASLLRPDDAYILDSYGWILFRLGKYEEAIQQLENAVERIPNDSALLDHLGDAYWLSGRENEAKYQWSQAHNLSQDPAFQLTVKEKIKSGIPAVDHKQAKL